MLKNCLVMAYALLAYGCGTAAFVALIVFLGGWHLAVSVNAGIERPMGEALFINTLLMLFWTLQHIGMARPGFKRVAARWIHPALERATYNEMCEFIETGARSVFLL